MSQIENYEMNVERKVTMKRDKGIFYNCKLNNPNDIYW